MSLLLVPAAPLLLVPVYTLLLAITHLEFRAVDRKPCYTCLCVFKQQHVNVLQWRPAKKLLHVPVGLD